jgi:sec-independent protein translocase protein TatA
MELNNIFLISMPGGSEWILIILVVVLLFGGRKIPELMKGLGQGMKEFKKAKEGEPENNDKKDSKSDSLNQ